MLLIIYFHPGTLIFTEIQDILYPSDSVENCKNLRKNEKIFKISKKIFMWFEKLL